MRTRFGKRAKAAAALLVMFLCLSVAVAPAAVAADEKADLGQSLNADQAKRLAGLPEAQRNTIRDDMNKQLAKKACGEFFFSSLMVGANCEKVSTAAYGTFLTTPEKAMAFDSGKPDDVKSFCAGLLQVKAPLPATAKCSVQAEIGQYLPILGAATRVALGQSPGGQFVLGTVDTVAFVANAKDGFEKFANTVKEGAVSTTNEVLKNLLKTSNLAIDSDFTATWAAFAAIGIVVLALMYFLLWKGVSNEEIDMEQAQKALVWYGPLSIVLVLYGPRIGYELNSWINALSDAFAPWTSERIGQFMEVIARFASYQSNGVFGPLVAVVCYGLLFIGGWGLLAIFFLQPYALYMLGAGIAVMIGFMIHPHFRERVSKTGTLWISIALSKPVLILLMGATFAFISSRPAFKDNGTDDALVNASSVFITGAVMLILAFSPALLFKFVPILPSSATGIGAGRSSVVGAATMAGAGALVGEGIRRARVAHSQAPSSRGGASTGGGSGQQAGSPGTTSPGTGSSSGSAGQESGGNAEGRSLGQLQRDARPGRSAGGQSGGGAASKAGAVARGSGKVAAGGAAAFLIAGREAARQAHMRGKQSTNSMVPDTDHISGR